MSSAGGLLLSPLLHRSTSFLDANTCCLILSGSWYFSNYTPFELFGKHLIRCFNVSQNISESGSWAFTHLDVVPRQQEVNKFFYLRALFSLENMRSQRVGCIWIYIMTEQALPEG